MKCSIFAVSFRFVYKCRWVCQFTSRSRQETTSQNYTPNSMTLKGEILWIPINIYCMLKRFVVLPSTSSYSSSIANRTVRYNNGSYLDEYFLKIQKSPNQITFKSFEMLSFRFELIAWALHAIKFYCYSIFYAGSFGPSAPTPNRANEKLMSILMKVRAQRERLVVMISHYSVDFVGVYLNSR